MKMLVVLAMWISIFGALLLQGCAPDVGTSSAPNTQIRFEPRLQDRPLNFSKMRSEKVFLAPGSGVTMSGSRLLNTMENLMWLGDNLSDIDLRGRGHEMARDFYANRDNATVAPVKDSLYLEAALGEKKTVLMNLLSEKLVEMRNSPGPIAQTVRDVLPLAQSVNSLALSQVAPHIQQIMDTFVARLQANGASRDLWWGLRDEVDKKYRGALVELGNELSLISPEKSVTENANHMRAVKKLPLGESTLKALDGQLSQAEDLSNRLAKMKTADEGVSILLDLWLMMEPSTRLQYFAGDSTLLSIVFGRLNAYTDEEIVAIRDGTAPWYYPIMRNLRSALVASVMYKGVNSIREAAAPALKKQFPVVFEKRLKKEVSALPDFVAAIVNESRVTAEATLKGLVGGGDYRKHFVNLSANWGIREIYAGRTETVGLERDSYRVQVREDSTVRVIPNDSVPKNTTSSAVLGASMSLAGLRLSRTTEFDNTTYDSSPYFRMVMEMLNKIPALGGFKQIDDKTYPSFHLFKGGRDPFAEALDIKNQAGSDKYFVVPDYIALSSPYRMDRSATLQFGAHFSVYNQAELLRGLSHSIEYFRDWRVNGFDARMSQYRLRDLIPSIPPHLEYEMLFPKDKLFEYSLGIASIILENMLREGSGLVMFGDNDLPYFGENFQEAKDAATLMAGMVDVRLDDRGDHIRTSAISKFVLGMAKFLEAMQGFENSKSKMIHQETCTTNEMGERTCEKKLLLRLQQSQRQIRMLMAMFSNFIVHRMQREDGTVDSLYSVKTRKVTSSSRNLEDQVLAIQALLTTGESLGMGVYLGAAYDIYFGMNHVFFNDKEGFYSLNDRNWRLPDSYVFSELMVALTKLSKKTDFSRGQINRLIDQFRGQMAH